MIEQVELLQLQVQAGAAVGLVGVFLGFRPRLERLTAGVAAPPAHWSNLRLQSAQYQRNGPSCQQ
jgi:hypothetical protein